MKEETVALVDMIDESYTEYRKPHMLLGFPSCTFKCDKEANASICQNSALAKSIKKSIKVEDLIARYVSNPYTEAMVFAGLEPLDTFDYVLSIVKALRAVGTLDDVVIYTGYYPEEVKDKITRLKDYENIIIKFGRFIPNCNKHFDEILGIQLASPNQYAEKIS